MYELEREKKVQTFTENIEKQVVKQKVKVLTNKMSKQMDGALLQKFTEQIEVIGQQEKEKREKEVSLKKKKTLTRQATRALYDKLAGPKVSKSVSPKRRKKLSPARKKKNSRPSSPLISSSSFVSSSDMERQHGLPKISPLDSSQPIFPTNLPEVDLKQQRELGLLMPPDFNLPDLKEAARVSDLGKLPVLPVSETPRIPEKKRKRCRVTELCNRLSMPKVLPMKAEDKEDSKKESKPSPKPKKESAFISKI